MSFEKGFFIETIEQFPSIWNLGHVDHKNKIMLENAWTKISTITASTGNCVISLTYEEEIARGELRKACSKRGNAIPPERRVNTTSRARTEKDIDQQPEEECLYDYTNSSKNCEVTMKVITVDQRCPLSTARLIALRELMRSVVHLGGSAIDAYIITSGDEHQSVEVDDYDRRREYISGFSGSYGDAIVTMDKAVLWTDGKYHLQADEEIDCNWLLMREGHKNIPTRSQWLKSQFSKGGKLGANPKIISEHMWKKFSHELNGTNIELIGLRVSLIDDIWPVKERPKKRNKPAFALESQYTGKSYSDKLEEVRKLVRNAGAEAMVVTSLDEIAWLLNIRGRDIPYSPFLRSYLLFDMNNVFLYVNPQQLSDNHVLDYFDAQTRLTTNDSVHIRNYSDIWKDLPTKSQLYRKILVPSHCVYSEGASHAIYEHIIFPEKRILHQSPIIYLKSVKNNVEIEGMTKAHVKDGAAMCDFFAHIEAETKKGTLFTEESMVRKLDAFRYEQLKCLGNSFRTIVGFAGNSAQPHYIPTKNTDATIYANGTILIESGGQYYEGTTSVARTIHFGEPDEMMKDAYTRVLIGQMAFSSLTFPNNMKLADADILARGPLWEVGLDYLHETGHGVGSFLSVRESPISIQYDSEVAMNQTFKAGYFFTIEPGYYKEGYFGIRLQNIFEVIDKPWLQHKSGHKYLGFKCLTLVPYQQKMINMKLLSSQQKKWLNRYNEKVRTEIGTELKRQGRMDAFFWMMENTKYIPENSAVIYHASLVLVLGVLAVTCLI